MDHGSYLELDTLSPAREPELKGLDLDVGRTHTKADAKLDRHIALVESRTFMRECIHRGMQAALSLPVVTFSTLAELEGQFNNSVALVFLSLADSGQEECVNALKTLSALDPNIPVVVLAAVNDMDLARTVISFGAKGYLPSTTNFEIAIEAVRFILAGGAYAPMDCLFASSPPRPSAKQPSTLSAVLTKREIRVVQAIQEGKSNKVIAYELCLCEGTVKVHMRNIMKKLGAKNRTDVAIKAHDMGAGQRAA